MPPLLRPYAYDKRLPVAIAIDFTEERDHFFPGVVFKFGDFYGSRKKAYAFLDLRDFSPKGFANLALFFDSTLF